MITAASPLVRSLVGASGSPTTGNQSNIDLCEAFSDGVIALIITIMVLEMKVPHDESCAVVRPLLPVFVSYVLSFLYVGIYWNNHHHLLHAAERVDGKVLSANLNV